MDIFNTTHALLKIFHVLNKLVTERHFTSYSNHHKQSVEHFLLVKAKYNGQINVMIKKVMVKKKVMQMNLECSENDCLQLFNLFSWLKEISLQGLN